MTKPSLHGVGRLPALMGILTADPQVPGLRPDYGYSGGQDGRLRHLLSVILIGVIVSICYILLSQGPGVQVVHVLPNRG